MSYQNFLDYIIENGFNPLKREGADVALEKLVNAANENGNAEGYDNGYEDGKSDCDSTDDAYEEGYEDGQENCV
jgi:hypothetical protein